MNNRIQSFKILEVQTNVCQNVCNAKKDQIVVQSAQKEQIVATGPVKNVKIKFNARPANKDINWMNSLTYASFSIPALLHFAKIATIQGKSVYNVQLATISTHKWRHVKHVYRTVWSVLTTTNAICVKQKIIGRMGHVDLVAKIAKHAIILPDVIFVLLNIFKTRMENAKSA